MSETNVWVGPGVICIGGKDYGFGSTLPASADDTTVASLRKKGHIADAVPAAKTAEKKDGSAELVKRIGELEADNTKLLKQIGVERGIILQHEKDASTMGETIASTTADLGELVKEHTALTGKLDESIANNTELSDKLDAAEEKIGELEMTVTEMTKQITTPAPSKKGGK